MDASTARPGLSSPAARASTARRRAGSSIMGNQVRNCAAGCRRSSPRPSRAVASPWRQRGLVPGSIAAARSTSTARSSRLARSSWTAEGLDAKQLQRLAEYVQMHPCCAGRLHHGEPGPRPAAPGPVSAGSLLRPGPRRGAVARRTSRPALRAVASTVASRGPRAGLIVAYSAGRWGPARGRGCSSWQAQVHRGPGGLRPDIVATRPSRPWRRPCRRLRGGAVPGTRDRHCGHRGPRPSPWRRRGPVPGPIVAAAQDVSTGTSSAAVAFIMAARFAPCGAGAVDRCCSWGLYGTVCAGPGSITATRPPDGAGRAAWWTVMPAIQGPWRDRGVTRGRAGVDRRRRPGPRRLARTLSKTFQAPHIRGAGGWWIVAGGRGLDWSPSPWWIVTAGRRGPWRRPWRQRGAGARADRRL